MYVSRSSLTIWSQSFDEGMFRLPANWFKNVDRLPQKMIGIDSLFWKDKKNGLIKFVNCTSIVLGQIAHFKFIPKGSFRSYAVSPTLRTCIALDTDFDSCDFILFMNKLNPISLPILTSKKSAITTCYFAENLWTFFKVPKIHWWAIHLRKFMQANAWDVCEKSLQRIKTWTEFHRQWNSNYVLYPSLTLTVKILAQILR